MKLKHSMLGASIALALIITPPTHADTTSNVLANLHTAEAPRITAVVNNNNLVSVHGTHLAINATPTSSIPDTATMNHLQLVLKPSVQRQAALKVLIAQQHNPQSSSFHQWITPEQYGENFGVTDADIATVTAWLTSQGFTVNNVYPNKTQIDFSGTAGQVRAAFHTQENLYMLTQTQGSTTTTVTHLSNNSDISIPAALQGVVTGVMGLNDFHAQAFAKKQHVMHWNAAAKTYEPTSDEDIQRQQITRQMALAGKFGGGAVGSAQSIAVGGKALSVAAGGVRGLVPFDMNQMYDANTLRLAGITGKGVTIAVVEDDDMVPADWTNFTQTFNLAQYGGTFTQVNPAPTSGATNCVDPDAVSGKQDDAFETLLDAEWSTALAPGANIVVATCADPAAGPDTNTFGGVYIAAQNEINLTTGRPNIISASYGLGEKFTDSTSKANIDSMWAQADVEGISVFVSTGDSGSNPSFNDSVINGAGVDANSLATSVDDTGVGGTDTVDVLDGTSSEYFASTTNAYGGSARGYVPEIPWNESCGNGPAAAALGYSGSVAFCQAWLAWDPDGRYVTSEAGSGGRSTVDAKPAWQAGVYNEAPEGWRDLPDVSLFAGSYGGYTWAVVCTQTYPCALNSSGQPTTAVDMGAGTSLSSPMFAGIQALVDQSLGSNGTPANQGNAAPILYALAQQEYGTSTTPNNTGLTNCASNDNGNYANNGCVFHNIVRGDNSTECVQVQFSAVTTYCYFLGVTVEHGTVAVGLTSNNQYPTDYTLSDRAYTTRPGWSLASGLGSVDVTNLVAAWKKYLASKQ